MNTALKNRAALTGLILIALLALCALAAGMLAPNDPLKISMESRFLDPSPAFPLGTDAYGRCILSRLLYGTRYSLGLAVLIMSIIAFTAIPAGMACAYRKGTAERLFLWVCDISMALPPAVLVLAIMGVMGSGINNLLFSTVFSYWGWYGRMVRSFTQAEMARGYVTYAVTGGAPAVSVLGGHILPNIVPGLLVLLAMGIGDTILMISGYSFLGIGLPAGLPEWGAMLSEAKSTLLTSPQHAIYPGLCVFLAVYAFNLLGEGMRKALGIAGKGGLHG